MMILTRDKYEKSIDVISTRTLRVSEIARTFINLLGLNHLVLSHVEHNNKNALASIHLNTKVSFYWVEQSMPLPLMIPNGFYLASEFKSFFPEHVLTTIREKYSTDNILFYVQHNRNSTDMFSIAANTENKSILSNYIRHAKTIKQFFIYFKQETRELLKEAIRYSFDYDFNIKLQKKIHPEKLIVPCYNGFSSLDDVASILSRREFECLQLSSSTLSIKSIANKLKLSSRTVESYLASVKDKLNCGTRNEMLDLYCALEAE